MFRSWLKTLGEQAHRGNSARRRSTTPGAPQQRAYYQSSVHAHAMAEAGVSYGARILFEELVRACGQRAYTWVLQERLADVMRASRRTVQRWEKELVRAGLLTVARLSFWWRGREGGVRRVAVPHVALGGALRPPDGVLDGTGRLVVDEVRTVRKAGCRRVQSTPRTIATRVARTPVASVSLLSKGVRERTRPPQSTPTPKPTAKELTWCANAIRGGVDWVVQVARERLRAWKISEASVLCANAHG